MGHVFKPRLLLNVGERITLDCPCSHAGPPSLLLVSHKRTGGTRQGRAGGGHAAYVGEQHQCTCLMGRLRTRPSAGAAASQPLTTSPTIAEPCGLHTPSAYRHSMHSICTWSWSTLSACSGAGTCQEALIKTGGRRLGVCCACRVLTH